jgi:hypothetical protein
MKASIATMRTIMVVSLALIVAFRYLDPQTPPSADEVKLWVGVVATVVISGKGVWSRLRGTRAFS